MTLPNLTGKTFRFRLFNILFSIFFLEHSDGRIAGSFEIGNTDAPPVADADPQPVAAEPLTLEKPDYDPATGEITFKTTGGDGSEIRFMAIGVTPWTTAPKHVIDAAIRSDPNSGPILIEAQQSGVTVSFSFDLHQDKTKTVPKSDSVTVSPVVTDSVPKRLKPYPQITVWNPEILKVEADVNPDGMAQITETTPVGGLYFINGGNAERSIPAGYRYRVGDEIVIYKVLSDNPDVYQAEWNQKGYAQIWL